MSENYMERAIPSPNQFREQVERALKALGVSEAKNEGNYGQKSGKYYISISHWGLHSLS